MYKIENIKNKIIVGDVIKELKKIPDNSIHLIITSPPYNVGMNYDKHNDKMNYKNYLSWVKEWVGECYRILISGGKIAVNLPSSILQSSNSRMAYLSLDYVLIMRDIGFLDREWIGWIKMPRGEIPGKSTSWGSWLSPSCPYCRDAMEYIIVMDKETHKRTDKKGKNDITRDEFLKFSSNCWYIKPETNRKHPAPFPLELPMRLIKFYTWDGDIVLDPFVGSGTTALASYLLKRNFIGIDISEEYCKMAEERIKKHMV